MHVLKHREKKPEKLIPIVSHFKVPFTKKLRGKKYNARGEYIGPSGPPKPIPDPYTIALVKKAYADAAKAGPVVEGGQFDLNRYRPMPGKVLLVRPDPIKELDGVTLPEINWIPRDWYIVLRVGANCSPYAQGDRVVFDKRHKPKPVKLGKGGFYLSPAKWIVAIVEATDPE